MSVTFARLNICKLKLSPLVKLQCRKLNLLSYQPHLLYTERHFDLQHTIKLFIEKEINPCVNEWEAAHEFPAKKLFYQLGQLGIFGVDKPTEYGGLGLDFSFNIAVAEAMGEITCGAIPMACAVQSDMATPALCNYGSDELKHEFLQPTIRGERVVCLGVSEQSAGSDVAAIKTTARRDGEEFIINGSKCWITNGHQADWICLLANTIGEMDTDADPYRNKSLLCVDMNLPGITRGRRIQKLGMHCSDTAEIFFDNVRVPVRNVIGRPRMGFRYQMEQFQNERLAGVALVLRPMRRILDTTIAYAVERQMFGGTAYEQHQCIRYTLAELSAELEALTSLLYRAVRLKLYADNAKKESEMARREVESLASMAKFKAGRLTRRLTDECLQIWGGNGFTWENAVSRAYRDFRVYSIGGGCDEVMLSIIAKNMAKRVREQNN